MRRWGSVCCSVRGRIVRLAVFRQLSSLMIVVIEQRQPHGLHDHQLKVSMRIMILTHLFQVSSSASTPSSFASSRCCGPALGSSSRHAEVCLSWRSCGCKANRNKAISNLSHDDSPRSLPCCGSLDCVQLCLPIRSDLICTSAVACVYIGRLHSPIVTTSLLLWLTLFLLIVSCIFGAIPMPTSSSASLSPVP